MIERQSSTVSSTEIAAASRCRAVRRSCSALAARAAVLRRRGPRERGEVGPIARGGGGQIGDLALLYGGARDGAPVLDGELEGERGCEPLAGREALLVGGLGACCALLSTELSSL